MTTEPTWRAARDDRRPLLLIDVDGVLNPYAARGLPAGFTRHTLGGFRVLLATQHGQWLNELRGDFELVWCTTWEEQANSLIGPVLGLPRLPVIKVNDSAGYRGYTWKLPAVQAAVGDRPLVWLDDDLGQDARAWARERNTRVATRLLIPQASAGLAPQHIIALKSFAAKLRR